MADAEEGAGEGEAEKPPEEGEAEGTAEQTDTDAGGGENEEGEEGEGGDEGEEGDEGDEGEEGEASADAGDEEEGSTEESGGEEEASAGEQPATDASKSEAEIIARDLEDVLIKAAVGEDEGDEAADEAASLARAESIGAAKAVQEELLSALQKKPEVLEKELAAQEEAAKRRSIARRASWKLEEDEVQKFAVREESVEIVKKERRVGYKSAMGGITQVPWTATKRRGPIAAEYQSPGPACVTLPNLTGGTSVPDSKRNRAPAFSFGSRPGGKQESPGPGPGQYNVTGLSAKGRDNPPASSLHSRPKEIKSPQTPAPGDYNPEKSEKIVHTSPKFTFGLKTQPGRTSSTPAPNVYNIPTVLGATKEGNKKQAPAFTISGRQKDKPDDRIKNPGPGAYNDAKADNYKAKSPAYSISSRYQMPSDPSPKPGPGAHSPEKVYMNLRWAPNYSFGIKHSPFKGDKGFKLLQDTSKSRCTCTC